MNGLDPQAYLADVLDRIHDHKINKLNELLPWNWAPLDPTPELARIMHGGLADVAQAVEIA